MRRLAGIWNERYANSEYVYGEEPNIYLKQKLEELPVGKILFVGEGEGRNAVYAAKRGWEVTAFDISTEGKKKAQQLAIKNNVYIDYQVGELHDMNYENEQFDVIALIFTHFPAKTRPLIHKELNNYLAQGGFILLEVFSKSQIGYQANNPNAGGPQNVDMLYDLEDIKSDFDYLKIIELNNAEIYLAEGDHHNGLSSVIRLMGEKRDFNADV